MEETQTLNEHVYTKSLSTLNHSATEVYPTQAVFDTTFMIPTSSSPMHDQTYWLSVYAALGIMQSRIFFKCFVLI